MAVSLAPFPLCCTARVLYNFGGGHIGQTEDYSKRDLISIVKNMLTVHKKTCAVVVAIPTSTQPNAVAALEELGFYWHPDGMAGGGTHVYGKQHAMHCMFMPLNEWDEKAFDDRYDPKKDDYIDGPNFGVKDNSKKVLW